MAKSEKKALKEREKQIKLKELEDKRNKKLAEIEAKKNLTK